MKEDLSGRPLRILYVIPDFGKGGAERALLDICHYLQTRPDFELRIVCLYRRNENAEGTKDLDIVYADYETFSLRGKNENLVYKQVLEEFRPDVVHTHLFLAEFLSSYYPDPSVKYVCHGHDNMIQLKRPGLSALTDRTKLLYAIERSWLIRKKYRKCRTWFIANSRHTFDYYIENLPAKMRRDVKLIEYGFDFGRFHYSGERAVGDGKIRLINVGSFQLKKNQRFLVKVAAELKNRGVDFQMDLVGAGEHMEAVREQIAAHGLEAHVFLRGIIDNVEDWYKKSDIYIHAATYEPFGLVFLEAMASGLPVITLNGKGNESVIRHGANGFIFDEQDEKLFADAIVRLLKDQSEYSATSEYGKEFAKGYDVRVKCAELAGFYHEIASMK
jgi:glycosyltransferase involved in cell wall biosynthesis